jgi:hypothetical protein
LRRVVAAGAPVAMAAGVFAWVSVSAVSGRAAAASCSVAGFDRVAGLAGGHGFVGAECAAGWALAVRSRESASGARLFRVRRGGWAEVKAYPAPEESPMPSALELIPAGSGIGSALLARLARPFGVAVREAATAGGLVEALAAREARLKASGMFQVSPVVSNAGAAWLVLEGADAGISLKPTWMPYPNGTIWVYRWTDDAWSRQAVVRGFFGPVGGCCGITPERLTGSRDPDFALEGGGAADTNWLTVISDAGGRWNAVPFDYGYGMTSVVNGVPQHHDIWTEVDATSAAGGPTTTLFETYQDGAFRPATPPGRSAPCNRQGLQVAAGDAQLEVFAFAKIACEDGWAAAIGTGAGYTGQILALFQATATKWRTVEVDNGESLGSDPGIYDIPLSLLRQLTSGFGASVRPALAIASLIAMPAMRGWPYLNGVIAWNGTDWYVKETPTGSPTSPGADAEILRWTGNTWVKQGQVDNVPASLDYYQAVSGGWFEPLAIPGSHDPAFAMQAAFGVQGTPTPSTAILTDKGGAWHTQAKP